MRKKSLVRTRAVTRRQYDNYIVEVQAGASWGQVKERPPIPMFKAYPVYDWRVTDVWAAPAKYGWDYCEAYDLMEMAGIKAISQRLAPPFGEQSYRQLWMWKICFPEIWEKMCQRVPGAAAAALYSTTELYNSGRRVKPFDLTWEQYLEVVISKHLPEYQTVLIQRVRDELTGTSSAPPIRWPHTWRIPIRGYRGLPGQGGGDCRPEKAQRSGYRSWEAALGVQG